MIDIHSHILYGIDDGSKSLNDSLEILNQAFQKGINEIVVTPHYIKNSKYKANNEEKEKILNTIKKELQKRNIPIQLYLGNEVFIEEDISSLLDKEISTINNSRYLLIELPMGSKSLIIEEVLDELEDKGIIPIIAHPERYLSYYKDYNFFYELKERGCYLQGNIGSLFGEYGRRSKKMLKELLKRDLIDCFGSDIHHSHQTFYQKNYQKELQKIIRDDKRVQDILTNNTKRIIRNEDLN